MKILLTFAVFIILVGGAIAQISTAHAVDISAAIPGSNSNVGAAGASGPGDYIGNFYQFALLIGGVLALAVVVYGGILYMTSIGNPSGQSEAKAWLWAAVWGILLLGGAYLILNIINPQLTNLTLPTLQNTGKTSNQVTVPATTQNSSQSQAGSSGNTTVNAAAAAAGTLTNAFVSGSGALVTPIVNVVGNSIATLVPSSVSNAVSAAGTGLLIGLSSVHLP